MKEMMNRLAQRFGKHGRSFVRMLVLVMALVMVLALAGCGKDDTTDPNGQNDSAVDQDDTANRVQPDPIVEPEGMEATFAKYKDVYAWIEVPEFASTLGSSTELSYPVAQHPTDRDFYLNRDLDGNSNKAGTLFTEAVVEGKTINGTDLNDPVTVIYGHNMANRTMFGGLQSYGETLKFDDNAVMYIYQPGRQLTYKFFACIPYDTSHILYYHDFKDEKVFNAFFEALGKAASDPKYKSDTNQNAFYSAEGCVNVDKTNLPKAGDKVVVLSVCKNGDDHHRYLLMAKLVEDSAAPITMTRGEAEAAGIPADRIQDKAAADAAAAAANVSAVEDAAANKTDTASKTDTAKTEHKG